MNDSSAEKTGTVSLSAPMNEPSIEARLKHLAENIARIRAGEAPLPETTRYVNNHIHTTYSFSPYSPSDAAYRAWRSGLATAGIMDHDSVSGALEFIEAGKRLNIGVTVGFECRCLMTSTPYDGRTLNNPDQPGIAYVACHGIPHQSIGEAGRWLEPYRQKRGQRNLSMLEHLNKLSGNGLALDYDRDVLPLSRAKEGGSVTERHLLYALTQKAVAISGRGEPLLALLRQRFGIEAQGKLREALLNESDPYYDYRVLGLLKSSLVEKFYIGASEECPHILEFVSFARSIGAIPAYAYLGDVGESVTGDKKTQAFEDAFLHELIPWMKEAGFTAVTYMPTRNSLRQLERLMKLCGENGLFEISGEDINTPFQPFICQHLARPEFSHLIDSAWALIGHEKAATESIDGGMFSARTVAALPVLSERISHFAAVGKGLKG